MNGDEVSKLTLAIERQGTMLQTRMDSNHEKAMTGITEVKVFTAGIDATLRERQGVCIEHARRLDTLESRGGREVSTVGPAPKPPAEGITIPWRWVVLALLGLTGSGGVSAVVVKLLGG